MSRPALEVIDGGKSASADLGLRELYARCGGTIFARCQYLLKDRAAAEDAMQEVFAKALSRGAEFRGEASPLTWLLKIATHHCLNLLRAQSAPARARFEQQERLRSEGHGGPHLLEIRQIVQRLLSQFDLETQAAVIHYHLDEMTLEEVAALLGRSVPTIRKRLKQFADASGQELEP